MASFRISRDTWYVILLLHIFIIHCASAVNKAAIAIFARIGKIATKSTLPASIIQSMALPTNTGIYNVSATVTTASIIDTTRKIRYPLI